jgi:hypothetical protein
MPLQIELQNWKNTWPVYMQYAVYHGAPFRSAMDLDASNKSRCSNSHGSEQEKTYFEAYEIGEKSFWPSDETAFHVGFIA